MLESENENERIPKRKKGVRFEENYQANKIKKAKLRGEEHISYNNKIVEKKFDPGSIDYNW